MTNIEILQESVLDEFIDELMSARFKESTGFTSVDLRVMEAFDFTPLDVLESAKLAEKYPDDLAPLHEGFGSFIGGLLMKPAVSGAGLNVAIAAIIGLAEKFLPAGGGILGTIGNFLRGGSGTANLVRGAATTIPGILAAAYKVSQDPNYQQAKARHNKAVCRRMMKKAVITAGVAGIVANIITAYLTSPKGEAQLTQTAEEAKVKVEQSGGDIKNPDAVAKEVAVESKLDSTEAKEAAAVVATNGKTNDASAGAKIISQEANNPAANETPVDQSSVSDASKTDVSETNTETTEENSEEAVADQNAPEAATVSKPISQGIDIDPKTHEVLGLTAAEQKGAHRATDLLNTYGIHAFKNPDGVLAAMKTQGCSEEEILGARKQLYANAAIALHDGQDNTLEDKFYSKAHQSYVNELSKGRNEAWSEYRDIEKHRDKNYDPLFQRFAADGNLSSEDKQEVEKIVAQRFDAEKGTAEYQQALHNATDNYNNAQIAAEEAEAKVNQAVNDGITGKGLSNIKQQLSSAISARDTAKKQLDIAQYNMNSVYNARNAVINNADTAFDSYQKKLSVAADMSDTQKYLTSLGVADPINAAQMSHAQAEASKDIDISNSNFFNTTNQVKTDSADAYNQGDEIAKAQMNLANTNQVNTSQVNPDLTRLNRKAQKDLTNINFNNSPSAEAVSNE